VLGNFREEVERLKAEVAQLKEVLKERDHHEAESLGQRFALQDELEKTQQALCISQPSCLTLIDEFLEFVGADRQGVTARQKINEALMSSQKQPRFSMLAKFRVWLESR
jgi:predicted nuclease with TOPRIM domain